MKLLRWLFGVKSPSEGLLRPQEPAGDVITISQADLRNRIDIAYAAGQIHGETIGEMNGMRSGVRLGYELSEAKKGTAK